MWFHPSRKNPGDQQRGQHHGHLVLVERLDAAVATM
jgi:hypothetical protein